MPIRGSIANSLKAFGSDRIGGMPAPKVGVIDYMMVAGGGGGGFSGGGGGGGGGVLFGSGYPVGPGITLTFSVGGGGGGGNGGSSSSITGPGTPTLTAVGGGDGADGPSGANIGGSGGSGGGGARDQPGPGTRNPTSAGTGTPGQGNKGGYGGTPPQGAAGGGGGANGGGQDGSSNPGQPYDNARNGGDGKSVIFDVWGNDIRTYLNAQGITGGGSWTAPNGRWDDFRMGSGGGNGIEGGPGSSFGLGGSGASWTGFPHTGGDGGSNDPARNANSACQYTGSGGGGGGANPGGGASPGGGSGSGGSIIIRYDEYFSNAVSTTGSACYAQFDGYRFFHFLGSGSITF